MASSRRSGGRRAGGVQRVRRVAGSLARRGAGVRREAVDGRIRLLRIVFVVVFLAVGGKAIALASASGNLTAMAANQQMRTIDLPAHRGAILDRQGQDLAVGEPRQTVYATPYMLKDPASAATQLAHALRLKKSAAWALQKTLADHNSGFAYVARKVSSTLATRALALDLPGVGSFPEEKRVYPMNTLAMQALGLAGMDNEGLAGLELQYNQALAGRAGSEVVIRDPAGLALKTLKSVQPVPGSDVRLTIDDDIQYTAEHVLEETVRTFHAKGATAVVMNPRTGAIYALACVPLVNAQTFGDSGYATRERIVTDAYEPGSIFKAVTVSGALSDGLVKPSTKFTLAPTITVGGRVIHDAEARGTETMTVSDIIAYSSNVGAVKIGMLLGRQRLMKWISAFGFGRPTGIDFPGEIGGLVPQQWSASSIGNIPMGQGIAVTPLQMAAAYSAIANGGVWMRPYLAAQVGTHVVQPGGARRVISAHVAKEMMGMLTEVVEKNGATGTLARIPGYVVAGKTGTAQIALSDGRGYSNSRLHGLVRRHRAGPGSAARGARAGGSTAPVLGRHGGRTGGARDRHVRFAASRHCSLSSRRESSGGAAGGGTAVW